jgi:arylsulfatase A-like enzyme
MIPQLQVVSRIGVLFVLLGCSAGAHTAAARNILVIIADDYGIDSQSLYNTNASASLPPTPNLNALAQRGVMFRKAYGQAVCSPSRCAMLTGRYGFRSGVTSPAMGGTSELQTNEFTLPEVLAANPQRGYAAASIGKWHLGGGMTGPNINGGWAHFSGALGGAVQSYTSWAKTVNGVSTPNYMTYATSDNVNDARTWIQQRGTNRWFLWLAFNAGHAPYHKPPNALHSYDSLPGTQADITANTRPYYEAMIEAMDTEIGRLLLQVDTNETTILFIGDNGTPGRVIQPPFSSARGKDTLYEGGVRVPFIIAGPEVVAPGRTSEAIVHCADIYATILELAGASLPMALPSDSRSLLPILLNQPFTPAEEAVLMENESGVAMAQSGRAVRRGNFKLIVPTSGSEEFYDLASDPLETANLLAQSLTAEQAAALQALRGKLSVWQNVPNLENAQRGAQFSTETRWFANASLSLWRSGDVAMTNWTEVSNATIQDAGFTIRLADPQPPTGRAFYRARND